MATNDPQPRTESDAEKSIQDGILKRIVNHMRENGHPDFEATDIAKIEPVKGGNSGPEIMIFGHNEDQMMPIKVEDLFSADELERLGKNNLKGEALRQNVEAAIKAPLPEKEPEVEADDAPGNDLDVPAPEPKPGETGDAEADAETTTDQPEAQTEKPNWRSRLWKALTGWIPGINKNDEKNREAEKIPPSFDPKKPLGEDAESTDEPALSAEPHTDSEPNFTLVGDPEPSPQPSRTSKTTGFNHPDDVTYRGDLNGGRVNFARRSLRTIARHVNIDPKKIESVSPVFHNGEIVPGDVEIQPKRGGLFSLFRKGNPMVRHFSEDRLLPDNVEKMIYLANGYAHGKYGQTAEPKAAKKPKAHKPKGEGWLSRFKRSWAERTAAAKARRDEAKVQNALNAAEAKTSAAEGDSPVTPTDIQTPSEEVLVSQSDAPGSEKILTSEEISGSEEIPTSGPDTEEVQNQPEDTGTEVKSDTAEPASDEEPPVEPTENADQPTEERVESQDVDNNAAGDAESAPEFDPQSTVEPAAEPAPRGPNNAGDTAFKKPSPFIEDAQKRKSLTKIADDVFNITFAENRQGIDLHDVQKAYADGNGNLVLSLNDPNAQDRFVSAESLAKLGTASVIALDLNALKAHRQAVSARHPASPDHIVQNFQAANDDTPPKETVKPLTTVDELGHGGQSPEQETVFDRLAQDMTRDSAGTKGGQITAASSYGPDYAKAVLMKSAPDLKMHHIEGVTSDGKSGLVLELSDGELRDITVDIDETQFKNTKELALAMNLAKQNQTRDEEEEMWAQYEAERPEAANG